MLVMSMSNNNNNCCKMLIILKKNSTDIHNIFNCFRTRHGTTRILYCRGGYSYLKGTSTTQISKSP